MVDQAVSVESLQIQSRLTMNERVVDLNQHFQCSWFTKARLRKAYQISRIRRRKLNKGKLPWQPAKVLEREERERQYKLQL